MEFKADKPIYRQIIDYAFARIISGSWQPGQRVPSVRELAVELAVNSHTVLKAYEVLQDEGIIAPRRGMGFFLEENAPGIVREQQRRDFLCNTLSTVFDRMEMLGISIDDLNEYYRNFTRNK